MPKTKPRVRPGAFTLDLGESANGWLSDIMDHYQQRPDTVGTLDKTSTIRWLISREWLALEKKKKKSE